MLKVRRFRLLQVVGVLLSSMPSAPRQRDGMDETEEEEKEEEKPMEEEEGEEEEEEEEEEGCGDDDDRRGRLEKEEDNIGKGRCKASYNIIMERSCCHRLFFSRFTTSFSRGTGQSFTATCHSSIPLVQ